jgi:hypothetical protein
MTASAASPIGYAPTRPWFVQELSLLDEETVPHGRREVISDPPSSQTLSQTLPHGPKAPKGNYPELGKKEKKEPEGKEERRSQWSKRPLASVVHEPVWERAG